jgi:outer membrane protein
MKSKFLRILLAAAVLFAISAIAQTGSPATPSSPSASSPKPASPAATPPPVNTGTKVGAVNIELAVFGSNEGNRDLEGLRKKFEPKQNELKSQSDELETLKKQLTTQGDKLNEDAAANLKKQIESKQKVFDRAVQDAQEEFGAQQQEIFGRILQKVAPVLIKYADDNGFGMIIDTSKQWPQGPVLMAGEALDITKAVVDLYNVQSGVAAPAASSGAAKPSAPRSGAAKPPASTPPSAPKPQ